MTLAKSLGTLTVLGALGFATPASAYTFKVLHNFCSKAGCADGDIPIGDLLLDEAGNLYGTTTHGGKYGNNGTGGTVFRLSPKGSKWTFHVLHSFCKQPSCADGFSPSAGLIIGTDGSLYGVAGGGGAHNGGVVFRLTPTGTGVYAFKLLYDFCSVVKGKQEICLDGGGPAAKVTYAGASSGAPYDGTSPLYGATTQGGGGAGEGGVVFALMPSSGKRWTETVLHAFCLTDCTDGTYITAPLWLDGTGNLFGTAQLGGDKGKGTVYELTPAGGGSWSFTRLYSFCPAKGCSDGKEPLSGVIMDGAGNLFGQTVDGGISDGVLYQIVPNGTSSTYTVLHQFCDDPQCVEGRLPHSGLYLDASGNIIATSTSGGTNGKGGGVYRWNGSTMEALYSFCSQPKCADGSESWTSVTLDSAGNLYGATSTGGPNEIPEENIGAGVIYELSP